MVYTSQTAALAVLEMLVHLGRASILRAHVLIPCTFDEPVVSRLDRKRLPKKWRSYPAPPELQLIGDEWVTKMDVGGPSEQPDGGDRMKAAFSDALKRAAVKFGVGRYLYRLPSQWVDYDAHRKQFVRTPTLPAFARNSSIIR